MANQTHISHSVKHWFFIIAFLLLCFSSVWAQERCGTLAYNKSLNKNMMGNPQFERWIKEKIQIRNQKAKSMRTQEETYFIPVVVHIIHNGEAVGVGANISDQQVKSQIQVLNKDFQRLNADAADTPAEFQAVAGSMSIQFVLAKQDPDGLPTTGIVRVQGSQSSWTRDNDETLKASSYWPAEDYYNVWVCNITSHLGYTQFPYYTGPLDGLNEQNSNRFTDGVVINYQAFGTIDVNPAFKLKPQYNKGRTLTHETGHFFGLLHIWGDDGESDLNCSGSDYVDDTPNQGKSSGAGSCSVTRSSCGFNNMFQNYMDYSDDKCMNIFTAGQVSRMKAVLENSIRRSTLLVSHGLIDPAPVPNDLTIASVTTPGITKCNGLLSPSILIKNVGTNDITSARISLKINTTLIETKDFNFSLSPYQTTTLDFSPYLLNTGVSKFELDILQVNGDSDGNSINNNYLRNTLVLEQNPESIAIPYRENFDLPFNDRWSIFNPANGRNWKIDQSTNYTTSLFVESFTNSTIDDQSWLVSPSLDFSKTSEASVFFDVSYAQSQSYDKLKVLASTGCDDVFTKVLYSDSTALSIKQSNRSWKPTNDADWKREFIDLTSLAGEDNVRLAFVLTNGNGNNLYLDNIEFFVSNNEFQRVFVNKYFVYYNVNSTDDFYVRFNLSEKQTVSLDIIDMMGRKISGTTLPDILNQTYPINLPDEIVEGIYIVRLRGNKLNDASRVFIRR